MVTPSFCLIFRNRMDVEKLRKFFPFCTPEVRPISTLRARSALFAFFGYSGGEYMTLLSSFAILSLKRDADLWRSGACLKHYRFEFWCNKRKIHARELKTVGTHKRNEKKILRWNKEKTHENFCKRHIASDYSGTETK